MILNQIPIDILKNQYKQCDLNYHIRMIHLNQDMIIKQYPSFIKKQKELNNHIKR